MKKFLLDTNICVYFAKGRYDLDRKVEQAGVENCLLSEITIAELKFGVENSEHREKNRKPIEDFIRRFTILLIGAMAIAHNLILVTINVSDFRRMQGIEIENWIEEMLT